MSGYEIVGVVTEVGNKVEKFKVGDKVGVGCLVGSCRECNSCNKDFENYCFKQVFIYGVKDTDGMITYGGFSDIMVVNEYFVIRWSENLFLDVGVLFMCAGIMIYSSFSYYGFDNSGLYIGMVGFGGFGYVAVKFVKVFGVKVTVISTFINKKKEVMEKLGADSFLVSRNEEEMRVAVGMLDGIFDTVSAVYFFSLLLSLLKIDGKLILVGVPDKLLEVPIFSDFLAGRKVLAGSMIGGLKEMQEMIDFAVKYNVLPDVEIIPMDYVNTAMERLYKFDVKYRFVIDVKKMLKVE